MSTLEDPELSDTATVRLTPSADRWDVAREIDLDSVDAFTDALYRTVGANPGEVTLDMSAVEFMDSSGLRALVAFHNAGHTVTIRNPSPQVRTLLELTRLDVFLTIE